MLKLRVVLSFAVFMTLTSFHGVVAQSAASSQSGSGDAYDAGHTAAPNTEAPISPTRTTPTTQGGGSRTSSAAVGEVIAPRWGHCDENVICAPDTFCKVLANGISICYPAY